MPPTQSQCYSSVKWAKYYSDPHSEYASSLIFNVYERVGTTHETLIVRHAWKSTLPRNTYTVNTAAENTRIKHPPIDNAYVLQYSDTRAR